MVLQDIADRADPVVEPRSPFGSEGLGHCDLYARDVPAIPEWLKDRVREPEDQQPLDGFFAQVVVDAEDVRLGE